MSDFLTGLNTGQLDSFGSSPDSGFNSLGQDDPTNSGDLGAIQDTSTPTFPSLNNPETAKSSGSFGAVLNNAISAGFAAWQLASLPKGTPKTVTTTVGQTTVTTARPSLTTSLFGATTPQQSKLIQIVLLLVVGLIIYKLVVK
jgi:hypothetical protein